MEKFLNHIFRLTALALLLFSSCTSDIVDDLILDDPESSGKITCKINGESFSSGFPLAVGGISTSGDIYTLVIGGLDFFGQDTIGVVIAINGTDFSSLLVGNEFTATGLITESLAIGTVTVDNGSVDEEATSVDTSEALIKITKIDRTNELVSGTFSYQALDIDAGTTYIVTEGVFTDIEYN